MRDLYFEDLKIGDRFETAGITITRSQIIDYALTYDPQPFHLDEEAAKSSIFGGLVASGFMTAALTFRLFRDTGVLTAANLGGAGGEDLVWPNPVRPGDTIRAVVEVLSKQQSRSRPERGRVRFGYTTLNQHGQIVLQMTLIHIVGLRRPGMVEV
ncbi:MAG TPA: MaoC family dehydratase [Azospirillaceae bacterium]|nr:MaoC family dehydratase [Azospirillaceae bacterium]